MELGQIGVQFPDYPGGFFTSSPPRTSERGAAARVFHWQGGDGRDGLGGSVFRRNLLIEKEYLLHPGVSGPLP